MKVNDNRKTISITTKLLLGLINPVMATQVKSLLAAAIDQTMGVASAEKLLASLKELRGSLFVLEYGGRRDSEKTNGSVKASDNKGIISIMFEADPSLE